MAWRNIRAFGAAVILGAMAADGKAACQSLELIGPGEVRGGAHREIPLYLAIPDTLGRLAVRPFLIAPDSQAKAMLVSSGWAANGEGAVSKAELRLLKALRDWLDGKVREAGESIAAQLAKAPSHLKPILEVDKALLFYSAGFFDDAERMWRIQAAAGAACREPARKNLFSFYLDRRRHDDARSLTARVLAGEPKDKWANEASAYLARMALSDEDFEAWLKTKTDGRDSLFGLQIAYASLLKEQGRYEEARRYYARGLEGSPRNGPAWLELAEVYEKLGLPLLAEASLEKCFEAGIRDPRVFEVMGRVLVEISRYAAEGVSARDRYVWGRLDMRDLQWNLGPEFADRCWRLAQANLERGLPHDIMNRSMAHLLYHVYCHNGKVDAARALRSGFWFHFSGPALPREPRLRPEGIGDAGPWTGPSARRQALLTVRLGFFGLPLAAAASRGDFFEALGPASGSF